MHQDSMVKLLKMLGSKIPMAQQRAGWFVASCPLAPWTHDGGTDKNPAFAVKKEPGDAFCTCFACGWVVRLDLNQCLACYVAVAENDELAELCFYDLVCVEHLFLSVVCWCD